MTDTNTIAKKTPHTHIRVYEIVSGILMNSANTRTTAIACDMVDVCAALISVFALAYLLLLQSLQYLLI